MRDSVAILVAAIASCVACNSNPRDNTCVVESTAISAAGAAAGTCEGRCESISAGDASVPFCFIDCTAGGQSTCDNNRTCASLSQLGLLDSGTSFCIHECARADGTNDAGACPPGYTCASQYGVCF